MRADMHSAASTLERLLEADRLTAGMSVRAHGDNLIVSRRYAGSANKKPAADDRIRLTRLGSAAWGLSVKRHTGRWERTPFSGSIEEMVGVMCTFMQHLVAS